LFQQLRRRVLRELAAVCILAVCSFETIAQEPSFSAGVKVVNVLATVRDKRHHILTDLTRDDFVLLEDGRPQKIAYFSRETDLPLVLGLLIDTSTSQRNVLSREEQASYQFLDTVLRETQDQAFVIHFDHDVEMLQDLTPLRKKLERSLGMLAIPRGPSRSVGTALYDAILLAADDVLKRQKGRKAVVILTNGVDVGSKVTIDRAIEAAQRADTLVYSILFGDEAGGFNGPVMGPYGGIARFPAGPPRPDGRKVLQQISNDTGGGFFQLTKRQSIERIYRLIQDDLRSQYNLGFSSDRPDPTAEFRNIRITTRARDMTVQARKGYYP
jgi:VWFA-related protein